MCARAPRPLSLLTLVLVPGVVAAEPPPVVGDGTSASPAVVRVGVPAPLRPRGAAAVAFGWGYTGDVLGEGDRHHRIQGAVAGDLTIVDTLAVGLRFDGRYDAHAGGPNGTDDGWVGDPRLVLRGRLPRAAGPWLGGQLTVWAPGGDAPSLVPEATSFDLVAEGAWPLARGALAANLGFRLDRSAAAVPDRGHLSRADRLSYGASDSNALLLGVGATHHVVPSVELLGEVTWDLLVGADAPSALRSPLRVSAGARWSLSDRLALSGIVDVDVGGRPPLGPDAPLAPVEPRLRVMAALGVSLDPPPPPPDAAPREAEPARRRPEAPTTASLTGRATTPSGVPLAGARVRVAGGDGTRELRTDAQGSFTVASLRAGDVTVVISADGHRDVTRTVTLHAGAAETFTQALPLDLPAGQIRGVISALSGGAVHATVTVESLDVSATTDTEGAFQVEVPPGTWVVVVQADGYRTQRRRLRVADNGVTFLNADLQAAPR